jgi:hypothetical protein
MLVVLDVGIVNVALPRFAPTFTSPQESPLIAFRALHGLGAALLSLVALSILTTTAANARYSNQSLTWLTDETAVSRTGTWLPLGARASGGRRLSADRQLGAPLRCSPSAGELAALAANAETRTQPIPGAVSPVALHEGAVATELRPDLPWESCRRRGPWSLAEAGTSSTALAGGSHGLRLGRAGRVFPFPIAVERALHLHEPDDRGDHQ